MSDLPAAALYDRIERLSSLFRAGQREIATEAGLKLVQLEALVYLSTANRYSDTATAVTEYLGVTKGTISETLKALERRGLIESVPDDDDGRVIHRRPTKAGKSLARRAHTPDWLAHVDPRDGESSVEALDELLRVIQAQRGHRTFGICHTCRFHQHEGEGRRCGLTGERLTKLDIGRLCREHERPTAAANPA